MVQHSKSLQFSSQEQLEKSSDQIQLVTVHDCLPHHLVKYDITNSDISIFCNWARFNEQHLLQYLSLNWVQQNLKDFAKIYWEANLLSFDTTTTFYLFLQWFLQVLKKLYVYILFSHIHHLWNLQATQHNNEQVLAEN